jgi:hypothetical protein
MTLRPGDGVVTKAAVGPLLGGVSKGRFAVVAAVDSFGRCTLQVGSQRITGVRENQLQRAGNGPAWARGSSSGSAGPFWAANPTRDSNGSRQAPRPLWAKPVDRGSSVRASPSLPPIVSRLLWDKPRQRSRPMRDEPSSATGREGMTPPPLFPQ